MKYVIYYLDNLTYCEMHVANIVKQNAHATHISGIVVENFQLIILAITIAMLIYTSIAENKKLAFICGSFNLVRQYIKIVHVRLHTKPTIENGMNQFQLTSQVLIAKNVPNVSPTKTKAEIICNVTIT